MKGKYGIKLICLLFAILNLYYLNAQKINYKIAAKELYQAIQDNFYISDSGYYRENAKGIKSDNPISYLWSLCAMVQAGEEMDVVFGGQNYFDQIMNVINKYKDNRPPVPGYASYKLENKVEDRYYDDNQWIGIAAFDAYNRTKKKDLSKSRRDYISLYDEWL